MRCLLSRSAAGSPTCWKHLDGKQNLEEILDEIKATYDVGRQQAEEDLQKFIEELLEAGLIEEDK
jgi:hypothetical protein